MNPCHNSVTREHFAALLAVIQDGAERIITDGMEHSAMVFCVALREGRLEFPESLSVAPLMNGPNGKNLVADIIRAKLAEFDIVAFASEAWSVGSTNDPAAAQAVKAYIESGGSLEHYPGRQEVLMVNLYSKNEQYVVGNPIARSQGKATLTRAPLPVEDPNSLYIGRFAILSE